MKLAVVFFREPIEPPGSPRDRNKVGMLQSLQESAAGTYCPDLRIVEIGTQAFVASGDELYPMGMVKRITRAKAEPKAEAKK